MIPHFEAVIETEDKSRKPLWGSSQKVPTQTAFKIPSKDSAQKKFETTRVYEGEISRMSVRSIRKISSRIGHPVNGVHHDHVDTVEDCQAAGHEAGSKG